MLDEDKRRLALERARRGTETGYKYYTPTGAGEEFINQIGSDKYFILLFSAANGVGKTYVGANILANLFWPCGNKFFQGGLFDKWPYPKRVRIITDPTTIHSTIIPTLKEVFPAGRYTSEKKGKNYEYMWQTDTGWTVEIMTYDQEVKEFESATLGLVWCDEPPPERIYKASISRLRKGGLLFITATPLMGSAWMYDHIVCNVNHEKGSRTYIHADVESACIEHGVRGFLKHKDIGRMLSEYDEDEMQARAKGLFQHLVGLVYKQFDAKVHILKPFHISLADYTVYEMLDPHPRVNDMISWVAVDKYNQKFVIDELWVKAKTEEMVAKIKQKAQQYRIVRRLADPAAFIEDKHTGKSLATMLGDYGLNYLPASKARTAADRRLGDALDFQRVGDEFIVTPELYFFETCPVHIYEITHWRWQEWKGKMGEDRDKKEKKVDKDDHGIENIGRCLLQEPVFIPYVAIKPNWANELTSEDANVLGGEDDPYS